MMKLNEDEKTQFRKLTVRTANIGEDGRLYNLGSGTIIGSGNNYYVLTAGHCVDGMDKNHIVIEWNNGIEFVPIEVKEIICCDYTHPAGTDYAVLRIEKPCDEVDYTIAIKRFDLTIPEESYFMLSYPPTARDGRFFDLNYNLDGYWEVSAEINYSQDDFKSAINGSSGAGIFVYRHKRYYFVGMAVATRDNVGRFNDIKALKPNVFDGIIPEDTKDNDYFDTLKTWEDWNDGHNAKERREIVRKLHVDWLDFLTRKAQVLFPSDFENKVDEYLKYYIKGMKIMSAMLVSNPAFVGELNKDNKRFFNRLVTIHKEDFDSSEGAYQDLQKIIDEVKKTVSRRFPEDRDDIIALDYALFRVTEKLLDCHLDYKPKV